MIYDQLLTIQRTKGAAFVVLIDPDDLSYDEMPQFLASCEAEGVDAFFMGGSLIYASDLDKYVKTLKSHTSLPIIGFPGSLSQVSKHLDALLFLSVISGRNPDYLFGQHVHAAPIIKRLGIETISTGYMLIESGRLTTAQYMSYTTPIPHNKPKVAAATALAAELLGMKMLFTDAGSGADHSVSNEMIYAITQTSSLPLVVGGGLRTPEAIAQKVAAGASIIVVGNALESNKSANYIQELAAAAHSRVPKLV